MSSIRSRKKLSKDIPYFWEWGLTLMIAFSILLFFCYIDATSLTIWSTNLLDCIWEGRPFAYYSYTSQNLHGVFHQSIGGIMLGLIPHSVWNIPIWILQYFFHVEIIDSVLCMIWSRCYYLLIMIVMLRYVYKICKELGYEREQNNLILLLCASSIYMATALWYGGQNDICWMLLAVIAVHSYINSDWKKFYLFINLALIFKPFFFPTAVLLILLKEKKIIEIVKKIFLSCIGYVVIAFLFGYFPGYKASVQSNDVQSSMFEQYLQNSISTPYGNASVLVIVFIVFCMVSFFVKYSSEEEFQNWMLYIIMSYNMIWLLTTCETFYRLVMIVPWVYLVLFRKKEQTELSLWLVLIYEGVSMLAIRLYDKLYLFTAQRGMAPSLIESVKIENAKNLIVSLFYRLDNGYEYLQSMVNGAWIGITIIILVCYCPIIRNKIHMRTISENRNDTIQRLLLISHIILVVPVATLAIVSVFV